MATIHDLPYEILIDIFLQNSLYDVEAPFSPFRTTFATSHVCHRWREITVKHPKLWTNCATSCPSPSRELCSELIKRCVRGLIQMVAFPALFEDMRLEDHIMAPTLSHVRSGTLVLHSTSIPSTCYGSRTVLTTLIPHLIPQTKTLLLNLQASQAKRLRALFRADVSHVEDLSVGVQHRSQQQLLPYAFQRTHPELCKSLDRQISSAVVPWQLRSLDLRGCGIRFANLSALVNLEVLALHNLPRKSRLTPNEWLQSASRLPRLKRLELVHATRRLTGRRIPRVGQEIKLRSVEHFTLVGPLAQVGQMLAWVILPAQCTVKVSCEAADDINQFPDVVRALGDLWFADGMVRGHVGMGPRIAIEVREGALRIKTLPSTEAPDFFIEFLWVTDPRLRVQCRRRPPSAWQRIDPYDLLWYTCRYMATAFRHAVDIIIHNQLPPPPPGEDHAELVKTLLKPLGEVECITVYGVGSVGLLGPFFLCPSEFVVTTSPTLEVEVIAGALNQYIDVDIQNITSNSQVAWEWSSFLLPLLPLLPSKCMDELCKSLLAMGLH
ncbi:hypothetical protein NLJ89_g1387 [Agrocybe chaxingu]|uniref:F-box domain-containing protein n=1 Tax=Agrocybe chaxingu TaxID=84603 RepID=A0A9W8N032_9AGAR|nr:hypothetical protein NLJ89_g1387 [Agrocybe chaxingu]